MRTRDFDKQQRIKEAMIRLILQEGIDGTSVSKIARAAEVSPATIYVYYASKEAMLSEVFQECSRQSYRYMIRRIRPEMTGGELIEAIVRSFYAFSREHEEIFSFVEQCSRCPTLAQQVSEADCCCDIYDLIHRYQAKGELKPYSDLNLSAVLFAPVKFLAMNRHTMQHRESAVLNELIQMLKSMLLS